jgi:type II secretory pathway component PulF
MPPSDKRPTHAGSLGRVVAAVAAVLVLGVAWFACRFIAPRYEASLMDAGLRPSPVAHGFLVASFFFVKYFWWIASILGSFFLISWAGTARPRAREVSGE